VGTYGFRGMKKNTPFIVQIVAKNVIRKLIDQVMKEAKIMISGPSP
jgi:ribosomal protein S11